MRRHAFLLALILACAPGAALAQAKAADPKPQTEPAKPRKPATLDELFTRLAGAKDEGEANGVANLIERRWARSGSDTADLLMSRAEEALKAKEFPLAVELLDRVLTLRPEWAEAWHRRATAFFLLDDPVSAIADIQRVLTQGAAPFRRLGRARPHLRVGRRQEARARSLSQGARDPPLPGEAPRGDRAPDARDRRPRHLIPPAGDEASRRRARRDRAAVAVRRRRDPGHRPRHRDALSAGRPLRRGRGRAPARRRDGAAGARARGDRASPARRLRLLGRSHDGARRAAGAALPGRRRRPAGQRLERPHRRRRGGLAGDAGAGHPRGAPGNRHRARHRGRPFLGRGARPEPRARPRRCRFGAGAAGAGEPSLARRRHLLVLPPGDLAGAGAAPHLDAATPGRAPPDGADLGVVFAPQAPPAGYVDRSRTPSCSARARSGRMPRTCPASTPSSSEQSRRYGAIRAPTAIVSGDADTIVWTNLHSRSLEREIPGARLVVLSGVGHMPHHAAPDIVAREIEAVAAKP